MQNRKGNLKMSGTKWMCFREFQFPWKQSAIMGGIATVMLMTGCASSYTNNYGFGSTSPGIIYSNQTRGSFMLPKAENLDGVEVLGPVRGEASELNVLLLVATGNGGIEEAKKDALKPYPDADDIINVEVDTNHFNILPIFNNSTTILRGIAVKYKKTETK